MTGSTALEPAVVGSIFEIDESQWDRCAGGVPFLRHGFFRALELSGVIGIENGLVPRYVVIRDGAGDIHAAAPVMLKWGNKREFGPEIRWLQAGLESGSFEWPKAQVCTPYYPRVTPKLLVRAGAPPEMKRDLLTVLRRLASTAHGRSAFNLMHLGAQDAQFCLDEGALLSREFRSVWHNPGVTSVDEYLRQLPRRARKRWRWERRQADSLNLRFDAVKGDEITESLLTDFYRGFEAVCTRHGNQPWIPIETFRQLCRQIPESVFLMTAHDGDRFCAGAFRFIGGGVLYNDTWSAPDASRSRLLVEIGCYQPIEYAITHGLHTVDAGLFAPYKSHRGYVAEPVHNAHWFENPELEALARDILDQSATAQSEESSDSSE